MQGLVSTLYMACARCGNLRVNSRPLKKIADGEKSGRLDVLCGKCYIEEKKKRRKEGRVR